MCSQGFNWKEVCIVSGNVLSQNRLTIITWTTVALDLWYHLESLGHNNNDSNIIISVYNIMMSSNGNIFCFIGPLWGDPPVTGGFPSQRPVTRSFDVIFDLHLNRWLSKQLWCQWFEMPLHSLWRPSNETVIISKIWQRTTSQLNM